MRKKILFLIFLIIAGTFSYYGGYHVYQMNRPKIELVRPESLQMAIQTKEMDDYRPKEYYVGKIKNDQLIIYKMPEEYLYDSIKLSSLDFYGEEETKLMEGMEFENLTEVFEFLENSMS
jgi:hypothetical protein